MITLTSGWMYFAVAPASEAAPRPNFGLTAP